MKKLKDVVFEGSGSELSKAIEELASASSAERAKELNWGILVAAQNGKGAAMRLLLKAGADANASDYAGCALLQTLRFAPQANKKDGAVECVRALIEAGADLNCCDKDGFMPLTALAQGGQSKIMSLLLAAGASPNQREGNEATGKTALMVAAKHGALAELKLLIGAGAELDACDKYGNSAPSLAANSGHLMCLKELLAAGASPDSTWALNADAAVHNAARRGHGDCLRELARAGADFDRLDSFRRSGADLIPAADREALLPWFQGRAQAEREAALLEAAAKPAPGMAKLASNEQEPKRGPGRRI